jgi:hypothetical protein
MVLGSRHQRGPFFARRIFARGLLIATSDVDDEGLGAWTVCAGTAKHQGYRALGSAGPQRSPLSRPHALDPSLAVLHSVEGVLRQSTALTPLSSRSTHDLNTPPWAATREQLVRRAFLSTKPSFCAIKGGRVSLGDSESGVDTGGIVQQCTLQHPLVFGNGVTRAYQSVSKQSSPCCTEPAAGHFGRQPTIPQVSIVL